MKVLQVLGRSTGGIGKHVRHLCSLLLDEEIEVAVAQPKANAYEEFPKGAYFSLSIPDRPSLGDTEGIKELRKIMRGFGVVHAHGLRAGAFSALALRGIPIEKRPRLLVTLHNQISGSMLARAAGNLLLRIICRYADVVFGVSPDLVELARSHGSRSAKLILIAAQELRKAGGMQEDIRKSLNITTEICFVTVARLAPQKGLDLLLDAVRHMSLSDFTWLIVGAGPLLEELEDASRDMPVRFLGERHDIYELLNMADVVVSTSVWEGQQIALQEALQLGKPVVATDVGGIPLVMGKAGVLVPPEATAIAQAMDEVGSDADLRKSLHRASLLQAEELPTSAQMLSQVLEAYTGDSAP